MKFSHINRRVHLYLGLSLLPWFVVYGVSSIPFSHPSWGESLYGKTGWTTRYEKPYRLELPPDADLKAAGAALKREVGAEGAYFPYRPDSSHINVYVHTFWSATEISYDAEKQFLRARDRGFRWDHFLTGMHARGGFQSDEVLVDAWAIVVDIVCIGFLIWIASGLYMWWHVPGHRRWGWVALGGGALSFVLFLLVL